MRTQIILLCLLFSSGLSAFAQQIPVGSCGIVNVYDAAGNRTKRTYFCNNGVDPYPQRAIVQATETAEFQEVDALFPNPTTGRFFITFSKSLENAVVAILDANGRVVSQTRTAGNRIELDLSARPAGIYYVRIIENGRHIVKKVIKQ
ncbi:MAG: T9SS type A sorting domain-containing protein [Niastella sp.]|nr:T9SS type A sorting domain-containing protein [Niastella sp.]